jgi:CarD family transcriptional regulator
MFKVNEKVVYPIHGVGKIEDKFDREFQDEKISYYKVFFEDSSVNVSVPIETAEEMGLRKPLSKKELKKELKDLGSKVRLGKKNIGEINEKAEEKVNTGKVEDVIEAMNMLTTARDKRKKEGKRLSTTSKNILSQARKFLRSEVKEVLGKTAVKEYELEE